MSESVDRGLAALRAELSDVHAPAAIEQALAAKFRRTHRSERPRLWWMPPLALAATIALATWMIRASHAPADPIRHGQQRHRGDAQCGAGRLA